MNFIRCIIKFHPCPVPPSAPHYPLGAQKSERAVECVTAPLPKTLRSHWKTIRNEQQVERLAGADSQLRKSGLMFFAAGETADQNE
jgi:hypothetical protein